MATPYVGEIRQFAGTFAPNGWALCDGSIKSIAENDVLFSLLGTTYGGNGQTTFGLPDLRGRVPVHMGTNFVIGQMAGSETVTVIGNQLPVHTHVPSASNVGSLDTPAGNVWANVTSSKPYGTAVAPATLSMGAQSTNAIGGSQPHENRIPFVAITYIIALYGVYPTQQ